MIQDHSFHIVLIGIQIILCFLFLFRKKINFRFLVIFSLFFSLSLYTSSSRLIFAHHHDNQSDGREHPCCQPLVLHLLSNNGFEVLDEKVITKEEKADSLVSLLDIDTRSIRAPPSITS